MAAWLGVRLGCLVRTSTYSDMWLASVCAERVKFDMSASGSSNIIHKYVVGIFIFENTLFESML